VKVESRRPFTFASQRSSNAAVFVDVGLFDFDEFVAGYFAHVALSGQAERHHVGGGGELRCSLRASSIRRATVSVIIARTPPATGRGAVRGAGHHAF